MTGKRKPTALKILSGDREDRINRYEPVPPESDGPIQPTVELDAYAMDVWHRLAPSLISRGVLTPWDADSFTSFCAAASEYRHAHEELAGESLTVIGSRGSLIAHALIKVRRDAQATMASIGAKFGLTPGDRSGIAIDKPPAKATGGKPDPSRLLT